jgi:hypothetical protein
VLVYVVIRPLEAIFAQNVVSIRSDDLRNGELTYVEVDERLEPLVALHLEVAVALEALLHDVEVLPQQGD